MINEANRTVTIWPNSADLRRATAHKWADWSVTCHPFVDGWSHHALITGRPSSDLRLDWPAIIHSVLMPLNDQWSIEGEGGIDLDSIVQMQLEWSDDISAGRACEYLDGRVATSIDQSSYLAYLLALIQLGKL